MEIEEMRRELESFCQNQINHYLNVIGDDKLTKVKPSEQEELLEDFIEFIQQYNY